MEFQTIQNLLLEIAAEIARLPAGGLYWERNDEDYYNHELTSTSRGFSSFIATPSPSGDFPSFLLRFPEMVRNLLDFAQRLSSEVVYLAALCHDLREDSAAFTAGQRAAWNKVLEILGEHRAVWRISLSRDYSVVAEAHLRDKLRPAKHQRSNSLEEQMEVRRRQQDLFGNMDLPGICMALRAAVNGSSDPWPAERIRETVSFLENRLSVWTVESGVYQGVDDAVYHLVRATIEEVSLWPWWKPSNGIPT